jgi:hypothetical protein
MRLYYLLQFFKGQFMFITQGKLLVFCYLWYPLSQCCKYHNDHNDEYTTKGQKGAGGTEEKRTRTESVSFRIECTTLDDLREESRLKVEKITRKKSR